MNAQLRARVGEDDQKLHLGYGKIVDGKTPKKGPGFSGRLVRLRTLSPDEVQHIRDEAYKDLGDGSRVGLMSDKIAQLGAEQMVVAMTEPTAPDKAAAAAWVTLNPGQLYAERSLLTTRDWELIKQLYLRWHHVSDADVDTIMEGLVGVVD